MCIYEKQYLDQVDEETGERWPAGPRRYSGHRPLSPGRFDAGTRVYHGGQRWPEARWGGTATVVHCIEMPDGTAEYLVRRDRPLLPGGDRLSWWASYHTDLADGEG